MQSEKAEKAEPWLNAAEKQLKRTHPFSPKGLKDNASRGIGAICADNKKLQSPSFPALWKSLSSTDYVD